MAVELVNNFLRDNQPKTYPMRIQTLSICNIAKKFEQFVLILLLDTFARVNNWYLEVKLIIWNQGRSQV